MHEGVGLSRFGEAKRLKLTGVGNDDFAVNLFDFTVITHIASNRFVVDVVAQVFRDIGQKPPLKLPEIWSIRIRLEMGSRVRDLALFNLAIDSKLRSCDLVKLRVSDIAHGNHILKRAMIMQQKTQSPVQFEITQKTRAAITHWIEQAKLSNSNFLFKGQTNSKGHISTRQYMPSQN